MILKTTKEKEYVEWKSSNNTIKEAEIFEWKNDKEEKYLTIIDFPDKRNKLVIWIEKKSGWEQVKFTYLIGALNSDHNTVKLDDTKKITYDKTGSKWKRNQKISLEFFNKATKTQNRRKSNVGKWNINKSRLKFKTLKARDPLKD
jgi:hypothetical protein